MTRDEKLTSIPRLSEALRDRAPVIPMISALGTADAVQVTREAEAAGASGFMVLPQYAYSSDWPEMKAHVSAVFAATTLPCMVYNNPLAYGTGSPTSRARPLDNLIVATGHAMMGISLAPVTGLLVSQIALREPPQFDLAALSPDRF